MHFLNLFKQVIDIFIFHFYNVHRDAMNISQGFYGRL